LAAAAALAALAVGAAGTAVLVRRAGPPSAAPLRRFELPSTIASASTGPVLSRDGSHIAYIAANHLRVQALDALESQDLGPMPITVENIFWSPDGRSIGFTADATIRTIPAAGGPAFVVARIPAFGVAQDLLWRTDGTIFLAVYRDSIYKVPAAGGTPEIVVRL